MSGLQLTPHLSTTFAEAVRLLSSGLPENRLVLSGGSVLQALWGHRFSTDLDFFIAGSTLSNQSGLAIGEVIITLDHMHYSFEPDVLRQAQENWRSRKKSRR